MCGWSSNERGQKVEKLCVLLKEGECVRVCLFPNVALKGLFGELDNKMRLNFVALHFFSFSLTLSVALCTTLVSPPPLSLSSLSPLLTLLSLLFSPLLCPSPLSLTFSPKSPTSFISFFFYLNLANGTGDGHLGTLLFMLFFRSSVQMHLLLLLWLLLLFICLLLL